MTTIAEAISANVRAEMARRSQTQNDIAALLGMSQNNVSRRLRGATPWRATEVGVLAEHFGISPADLMTSQAGAA